MSHTTPKHPILDRTEHFRSTVDRLQLDCLDTVWQGQLTPLRFVCAKGHVVLKSPLRIRRSHQPCSECLQEQLTERLRATARDVGVLWLNETWLGSTRNHQFCCAGGHRWQRAGAKALVSCACPVCGPRSVLRLNSVQRLRRGEHKVGEGATELERTCAARGGVCLSAKSPSGKGMQRFRCQAGHEWEALASTVMRGGWCRRCASLKAKALTLADARQQARHFGGQCLSQVFVNAQEDLQWDCGFGHTWFAPLAKVRCGNWCRTCSNLGRSSWKKVAKFRAQDKALMERD